MKLFQYSFVPYCWQNKRTFDKIEYKFATMYLFINEYNGLYILNYKYNKWTLFLVLNLSKIYKIWLIFLNKKFRLSYDINNQLFTIF